MTTPIRQEKFIAVINRVFKRKPLNFKMKCIEQQQDERLSHSGDAKQTLVHNLVNEKEISSYGQLLTLTMIMK